MARKTTYLTSLQQALHRMMAEDDRVIVLGEDILDPYGGAFKVTKGLSTAFPDRVWSTPISEAAIVGVANGLALRGMRPVAEIMFGDFITLAADQIINHAAKFRAMYNQQVSVPVTIRTPMGGGRGYGPTHSQSLEKLYLGIPHLHVIAPSLFHHPGELLRQAVLLDDDPVLFIEHKSLYPAPLLTQTDDFESNAVEDGSGYPAMRVRNAISGAPDVIIITYGGLSLPLADSLRQLAREEVAALAYLPGSLHPLNLAPIFDDAARTGRIVIVEDGPEGFGWSAEAAVQIYDAVGSRLTAPIRRVAARPDIIPAAQHLEAETIVTASKIEQAIWEVLFSA